MIRRTRLSIGFVFVLAASLAGAQSNPPAKNGSGTKSVKAESVTINMPEGMTKDQADAILNELKGIHQLLLNQQNANAKAAPGPVPASDKVQMKLASGWYSIGRDDAPVTMVEFTDYQCPFCRKYHTDAFAELKKNYIDTGKVRFISRDLPLDFHPYAQKDAADASTLGISGTPSFVIGKASRGTLDGDRLVGAVAASVFEAEFQKFL